MPERVRSASLIPGMSRPTLEASPDTDASLKAT